MTDEIVQSNSRTLDFLRRLVADVPNNLMTRQSGGAVNHPAWVIGHLVYSCQAIGGELGLDAWLPSDWEQRFGTGSIPVDKPAAYPKKGELLSALDEGQRRITERLKQMGDQSLSAPLPDVRHRSIFPTIGHAVLHILTGHAAVHVGQLTVWRRTVGLGPLPEPFV